VEFKEGEIMKKETFLNELAQLLELDVNLLKKDYPLKENQLWDSLAIVSTIASVDQHYQLAVKGIEIEHCETLDDLFSLIDKKQKTTNNILQFAS
jgi:acyl carrier protein